ncbi:hypothetical protein [Streptomyces sp. NPDC088400]|uniref:hypothetical protein n=1 Tax=Streptomyces sp. NPDC088400 TaxID=3365861 RepID=UPI0038007F22
MKRRPPLPGRILRIELRRSTALRAGVLLLVTLLGNMLMPNAPWWKGDESWVAQLTYTAWWLRTLMLFLWPVSVAAGAIQGIRDHRSGTSELLATTARPVWHRAARTAGALGLAVAVAYLLVFLYGGVQVIGNDGFVHLGWLPVLAVGMLALVAGAFLGMGVAKTLPSIFTPPALALVSLVAVMLVHDSLQLSAPNRLVLLSPSLSPVHSPFLTVPWQVNLGQSVWLLGLAVTGFLLLTAGKTRTRLLALLPVVLGAAVALPLLPSDPGRNYAVDKAATALVCADHVCVTKVHEPLLDAFKGPGAEALRLLGRLPDPPSAVHESVDAGPEGAKAPRTADLVSVDFEARDLIGATKDETLRILLAGAGTAACSDAFGEASVIDGKPVGQDKVIRERAARTVAASWFTGELKPLPGPRVWRAETLALARPAWDALRALPADEQRERISALRTASLSCDTDLLRVLADGASR